MQLSEKGVFLIKNFEGVRLKAYKCPAGVWTIGYGHTKGVTAGMEISSQKAEEFLKEDVRPIEALLNKLGINFCQNQFDALVSWIFNLGSGNFASSTLKKYILADKQDEEITDQLVKWHFAGKTPLLGLKRRRVDEANLFLDKQRYYVDSVGNIKKQ